MFCYFCMCYSGYNGIGETCWCWDATPESDSWVMEWAVWETMDSTDLELCFEQWSLHQRCLQFNVSSLSRLVVWRCLADSVLASSSAGRCDVWPTCRWTLLTCARQFLIWAYCTYLFTYLLWLAFWYILECSILECSVFPVCMCTISVFEKCRWRSITCVISVSVLVCSGMDFSRC